MQKTLLTLTALTIALAGCKPLVDTSGTNGDAMEKDTMQKEEVMEGAMTKGYAAYEEGVLRDGKQKVLFFHAAWCPYCIEKDKNLKEWYGAEQIPLPVYRIDFDTATALKKQYGITTQDSFVLVDGNGNTQITLVSPSLVELKRLLYGNMEKAKAAS